MQYFQVNENDRLKRRIYLHLVDATDGITPETGEAGGRAKVSLNGATPTSSANTLTTINQTDQPGTYYLELSPTEIQHPGIIIARYKSANTAEFVALGQVMAFDPYTQFGTLGGGGADIDYKRIKKIVDESVSAIQIPEAKEPEKFDYETLAKGFESVLTAIKSIEIPETDLQPVVRILEVLQTDIKAIKIPETDLSETNSLITSKNDVLDLLAEAQEEIKSGQLERIKRFFENGIDKIIADIAAMKEKVDNAQLVVLEQKENKQNKPSVLDEYLNLDK